MEKERVAYMVVDDVVDFVEQMDITPYIKGYIYIESSNKLVHVYPWTRDNARDFRDKDIVFKYSGPGIFVGHDAETSDTISICIFPPRWVCVKYDDDGFANDKSNLYVYDHISEFKKYCHGEIKHVLGDHEIYLNIHTSDKLVVIEERFNTIRSEVICCQEYIDNLRNTPSNKEPEELNDFHKDLRKEFKSKKFKNFDRMLNKRFNILETIFYRQNSNNIDDIKSYPCQSINIILTKAGLRLLYTDFNGDIVTIGKDASFPNGVSSYDYIKSYLNRDYSKCTSFEELYPFFKSPNKSIRELCNLFLEEHHKYSRKGT